MTEFFDYQRLSKPADMNQATSVSIDFTDSELMTDVVVRSGYPTIPVISQVTYEWFYIILNSI